MGLDLEALEQSIVCRYPCCDQQVSHVQLVIVAQSLDPNAIILSHCGLYSILQCIGQTSSLYLSSFGSRLLMTIVSIRLFVTISIVAVCSAGKLRSRKKNFGKCDPTAVHCLRIRFSFEIKDHHCLIH